MVTQKVVKISYSEKKPVTVTSQSHPAWICKCESVHPILHGSVKAGSVSQIACPICDCKYLAKKIKTSRRIFIDLFEFG